MADLNSAEKQHWLIENLSSLLKSNLESQTSFNVLYDELNTVFKVDPSLDTSMIIELNILLATLLKLPKGVELFKKLISTALASGFQIKFIKNSCFSALYPKIEEGNLTIVVSIVPEKEINRDTVTFARLRYNPQTKNYSLTQMIYPLFIVLAHELVHSLHHMKWYNILIKKYTDCPALNGTNEDWENFSRKLFYENNIKFSSNNISSYYQRFVYRIIAQDSFKEIFGFSSFENKTESQSNLSFFWDDNQEEESLTIIGDGILGDTIFLEEAREYQLLNQTDGYDDGPIFRWGHGTYTHVTGVNLDQKEFDECVRLIQKILPVGLK